MSCQKNPSIVRAGLLVSLVSAINTVGQKSLLLFYRRSWLNPVADVKYGLCPYSQHAPVMCPDSVKGKLCTKSLVGCPEETATSHLMNFTGIIWDGDIQDEIPRVSTWKVMVGSNFYDLLWRSTIFFWRELSSERIRVKLSDLRSQGNSGNWWREFLQKRCARQAPGL